jgi:hypothetical protein
MKLQSRTYIHIVIHRLVAWQWLGKHVPAAANNTGAVFSVSTRITLLKNNELKGKGNLFLRNITSYILDYTI